MGSAHILMHRELIARLRSEPYASQIKLVQMTEYDDEGMFTVTVESDRLPEGYNGEMAVYIRGDELFFMKDLDT